MGNVIGILSTVILVCTLATLIFAVGAYILARRRRRLEAEPEQAPEHEPEEPVAPLTVAPPFPPPSATAVEKPAEKKPPAAEEEPRASKPAFRQLTPRGEKAASPQPGSDDTEWEWE